MLISLFMMIACGGESSQGPTKEASEEDVAILIDIQETSRDKEITTLVDSDTYRKADIVDIESSEVGLSKTSYKLDNTSNVGVQSSKVESNGENDSDWVTYSDTENSTISSEYDAERGSDVIKLDGNAQNSGYSLGYSFSTGSSWNDATNKTIKWSMKFNESYTIYVRVSTTDGYRYLYYTPSNINYGVSSEDAPHYIHHGLGSSSDDGEWVTFTRDLTADLKRFDTFNEITSVDGFLVRGSGSIDDVELLSSEASTSVNEIVYEDAEDGQDSRWEIYDNDPEGASVQNVTDADKASEVIELSGDGLNNGFALGAWNNSWKNTINKEISWDVKTDEDFIFYVSVLTDDGHRFMTYIPMSTTTCANYRATGTYPDVYGPQVIDGYTYIRIGLCPDEVKDGNWNTVSRNLENDLKLYEPSNSLVSVSGFLARGNMRLDNIKMFDTNTDGDYDNSTN